MAEQLDADTGLPVGMIRDPFAGNAPEAITGAPVTIATIPPVTSALAPEAPTREPVAELRGPFDRFVPEGPARTVVNWLGVVLSVYLLISAVGMIGDGFQTATNGRAEQLFAFASNPFVALMVGVLATVATQSSSTTTAITVGLAAGGLPLHIAIPIVMGANIGTTMTNTLVSLGMVANKEDFRRAFAAATVHDFFNLFAVAILLPLEIFTGYLERASGVLANALSGVGGVDTDSIDFVGAATAPLPALGTWATSPLPALWGGILMVAVGVALILLSITLVSRILKVLMVGRVQDVLHASVGRGPVSGVVSGAALTAVVQSSSTATSLMVPLAGAGTFTLRQVYAFTVGSNIGTTATALIAAFGLSGASAGLGLQVALVHLLFNLSATLILFVPPFIRPAAIICSTWLANRAAENKLYVVTWVLGVFVVIPGILIALTSIF